MAMVNQVNINNIIQQALAQGVSMDTIQGAATQTNQQTGGNVQIPTSFTQPQQNTTQQPSQQQTSNFGDLGGASNVQSQPINFQQQTFQAPSQFAFGQGATQLEQQQQGYLTQRNNFLAQNLLQQGLTDSSSIFENLSSQYSDFAGADMTDRQNTAQAIANRIAQIQAEQGGEPQLGQPGFDTQADIDAYRARVTGEAEAAAGAAQQDLLQQVQQAGVTGLDRPLEDLERNRTLQQRALDRALEQTRFSVNNQIDDVALQAQRNVEMGDKIGALKGFNRSSGYVQGIQNIKDDADRAIGRLQQQLAFAEQYTGEDKAEILADFDRNVSRVHEDFAYQTRSLRQNAEISINELSSKYGLSEEKLAIELEKVAFDFSIKAEELVGQYIANTRSAINVTNDQIGVLQNYDNFLKSQTEAFTSIINMDGGAALAAMSYMDIDKAVQEGRLLPQQAEGYKQLMLGKAINTLSTAGVPTQADIQNLMTAVQGGMSPAAALMQIIGNNPSRYAPVSNISAGQQNITQVPGFGPVDVNNPNNYRMRTDRHNNPTAMTTDVAKTLGLIEGVDYVKGDEFPNNPNIFTARLLGDPIQTTIKAIDMAAQSPNKKAFYTQGGQQRRTYIGMSDDQWLSMTPEQKANTVLGMYKQEGGSGVLAQGSTIGGQTQGKDTYLQLVKRGGLTNTDKKEIAEMAIKEGWTDEFNAALQEGAVVDLTPTQQTQYNKEYDRFLGNQVVKGFEEGLTQFQSLSYALGDKSGPGDMAGVFAFMKTLDPSSVVREAEFESAANSAGVANKWSNIYNKLSEGKVLTAGQAEDFKKIATKFIESRGQSYNRLYKNLENAYTQFGISKELLPINAVDQLNTFLSNPEGTGTGGGTGTGTQQTTPDQINNYLNSLFN